MFSNPIGAPNQMLSIQWLITVSRLVNSVSRSHWYDYECDTECE